MNYRENYSKLECMKIAYIGGGSRGWARGLMSDLATEPTMSGDVYLYDIDMAAAKANETIGNSLYNREDVVGKWHYIVANSLQEALINADFVIISILPATFKESAVDVHWPEKYGIYQSVGDTVGPGGIIRALRTIPMIKEIALAIKEFSPNAWVINYTNPMSITVKTLYKVFPEIKAFGCCHEVFGTQDLLNAMIEEKYGIKAERKDIKVDVSGINHFTWLSEAQFKGIDLLEEYKDFVKVHYEEGFFGTDANHWMNNSFVCNHRVKFDLFKRFGAIAAAGDRHLAEFCPGDWYLGSPENVAKWKFGLTTVAWRMDDLQKRLSETERLLNGEEFVLKCTGEEGVKQIKALVGLGDMVTNCNYPNIGQAPDLPMGAIVETNVYFSDDHIRPVCSKPLPEPVKEMITKIIEEQELVVEAGLTENYDLALKAFLMDNLIVIPEAKAKQLFFEMVEETKSWLPGAEEYLAIKKQKV